MLARLSIRPALERQLARGRRPQSAKREQRQYHDRKQHHRPQHSGMAFRPRPLVGASGILRVVRPRIQLRLRSRSVLVKEARIVVDGSGKFLVAVIEPQRRLALWIEIDTALNREQLGPADVERRIVPVVDSNIEPAWNPRGGEG